MPSASQRDHSTKEEIDRLARTLAKDPRSKAFLPLADEYVKAGMWPEAAAVLEDGLKVYPGFVTAMVALGRVYDQLKSVHKAKPILEEALKLSPDNLRAHRILAKIYLHEGARDLAQRSCQVILAVNPHDEEALSMTRSLAQQPATVISAPAEPNLVPEPLPEIEPATSAPQRIQVEEVQTEPVARGNPPSPTNNEKVVRLEHWLKDIQAKRRATT